MDVAARLLIGKFPERYPNSGKPLLYRAPGRVNLIGEHTDYNLGFVMPIAIDLACYAAAAPAHEPGRMRVYSEDMLQGHEWTLEQLAAVEPAGAWTDYVVGVARQLEGSGAAIAALDVLIHSSVPVGAGLSSSAALEIASALALSNGAVPDGIALAKLCHRAENEFVGLPCGIMDQFISVLGKANRAIQLDCRSLAFEEVPLPENVAILAVNTMVKHELGTSAYRQRVAECARAVLAIQHQHEQVESLRDATLDMLDAVPGLLQKRARHVITENQRVIQFAQAARQGDRRRMGELFLASHQSLSRDYEVSCLELDYLADTALHLEGVFGARMTGGGFGGCTVNLVDPAAVEPFRARITECYRGRFGREPQIYECRPSAGAGPIFY